MRDLLKAEENLCSLRNKVIPKYWRGETRGRKSLFRHRKRAMGDLQVQAAAVLPVVCEAAADPEVCVGFIAVPHLGGKCYVPVCSELVAAGEGGGPLPSPCHYNSPFSVLPSP